MHPMRNQFRLIIPNKMSPNTLVFHSQWRARCGHERRVCSGPSYPIRRSIYLGARHLLPYPSFLAIDSTPTTLLPPTLYHVNHTSTPSTRSAISHLDALSERSDASRNANRTLDKCDYFSKASFKAWKSSRVPQTPFGGAIAPINRPYLGQRPFESALSAPRHFREDCDTIIQTSGSKSFT